MITDINCEKLVIISDIHLGNPFCKARGKMVDFIRWASAKGYDICINGDGLEIAQVAFEKIARDVPEVFQTIRSVGKKGTQVFYVVGNHDIALEYFLEDWGAFKLAPFLNLVSGSSRIRIEHGHLYDPFFIRSPRLYEFMTQFGGLFLKVSPSFYRVWIGLEKFLSIFWLSKKDRIRGEHPNFVLAAQELLDRGFDSVVFGHTHHEGVVEFEDGKKYLNPGSWLLNEKYICIEHGKVELKDWKP